MKKIILLISLMFSLILTGCFVIPKYSSEFAVAKDIASKQDWFDYSYEIIQNRDEDNNIRYHVTYYWSKTDGTNGIVEYIFTYTKDDYKYEKLD